MCSLHSSDLVSEDTKGGGASACAFHADKMPTAMDLYGSAFAVAVALVSAAGLSALALCGGIWFCCSFERRSSPREGLTQPLVVPRPRERAVMDDP